MADRIVQPKVLASTNPDTYDNLIFQQAQNATNVTNSINGNAISNIFESDGITVKNATNANNGLFSQSFTTFSSFSTWESNNDCLYFDIKFPTTQNYSNCPTYTLTSQNGISFSADGIFGFKAGYKYRFIKSMVKNSNTNCYSCAFQYSNVQSQFTANLTLFHFTPSSSWDIDGQFSQSSSDFISFSNFPFSTTFSVSGTGLVIIAYYR